MKEVTLKSAPGTLWRHGATTGSLHIGPSVGLGVPAEADTAAPGIGVPFQSRDTKERRRRVAPAAKSLRRFGLILGGGAVVIVLVVTLHGVFE